MLDYLIFGFIQFCLGLAFTFYPPKKINNMYGYWGKAAKSSPEAWQKAHNTIGPLFLIFGLLALVVGYSLYQTDFEYRRAISIFFALILGGLAIWLTERRLKIFNS